MAKQTYARLDRAEEKIEDQKKKLKKAELMQDIQKAVKSAMRAPKKRMKK